MTEQQACTLCGAGGHSAAQCSMEMDLIRHIAGLYSGKAIKGDFTQVYITGNEIWMAQQILASQQRGALAQPAEVSAVRGGVDVAGDRFEIPVQGWEQPLPPEPPVECPHRCGSVFVRESYGAGFIEGSGMCPDCDAAMPAKDIVKPSATPTLARLELTEDLKNILGRPNFTCTHLAQALRQMDLVIDRKSEAEQAACLHWMLNHYLAHGADWKVHAEAELKAAAVAQGGE